MPTTYTPADAEVYELVDQVMKRHHQPLDQAGVKIGILMASAVKHNGYTAYASIKIVPLKDRVAKNYDVELLIDAAEWEHMRERHRLALIDHELSHVELAASRKLGAEVAAGIAFDRDDLNRPKLKLVKGDWSGSVGFRRVVMRHGEFAIEFLNAKRVHRLAVAAKDDISPETQKAIDNLHGD